MASEGYKGRQEPTRQVAGSRVGVGGRGDFAQTRCAVGYYLVSTPARQSLSARSLIVSTTGRFRLDMRSRTRVRSTR